jgi:hypothetical protein
MPVTEWQNCTYENIGKIGNVSTKSGIYLNVEK